MKRIKSAPANIAEMVNRKKPIQTPLSANLVVFCSKEEEKEEKEEKEEEQEEEQTNQVTINIKTKKYLTPFKIQKNIEKTVNSVMLDYIGDKQLINTNDEGVLILSILYYYICEKTFTKKNINEFMLFIVQIFIKYLFTHKLHEYYIQHSELINHKIALLEHSMQIF
jgi:hypothetical protein